MTYFQVPLTRPGGLIAHVRENDYRVVFSPSGVTDSARLFEDHGPTLDLRQPRQDRLPSQRTVTAYFVLTDGCNLRCEYCDVLGRSSERKAGQAMTWEMAERGLEILLQRLEREPDLHAQVTFFGGEPLLSWGLLKRMCQRLATDPNQSRIAKMLVTNGTLLDADRCAFLLEHQVYVVVSLDGGPGVNDAMRPASFDAVAAGLDHLHAVMPGRYGISCTVGSHNAATLSSELRFLNERFKPLSIGLNIYHYQRDGSSPIAMPAEALAAALLDAFRTARQEKIAIYQFIGILKAFVQRRRNLDYCPACVDKLLFTPRGRVGRCETLMDDPRFTVPLEGQRDHDLGKRLDWTRYTPEHEPACQSCSTRWVCPGSCAYDMLVTTGKPDGVDPRRCDFHRGLLTEMLALLYESCPDRADGQVVIPDQTAFDAVVGGIPTSFPPATIWIVSLASVSADTQGGSHAA